MTLEEWDRSGPSAALAAALAAIHGQAFADGTRAWSGPEMAGLMGERTTGICLARAGAGCDAGVSGLVGFGLYRVAADEAELVTLAVLPGSRRMGWGARLLAGCEAAAWRRGAVRMFLEVSETNLVARALYAAAGFAETGRRRGYYRHGDGGRADAIVMAKAMPGGPAAAGRRGPARAAGR